MISYAPFWKTLKSKNVSTYRLIKYHNISNGTLYRMRRGEHMSTATLELFCSILDCRIEDIVEYLPPGDRPPD